MTTPAPPRWAPVLLVIASMSSVQVGASISVPLFDRLGVAGTTWLRLLAAALVLLTHQGTLHTSGSTPRI